MLSQSTRSKSCQERIQKIWFVWENTTGEFCHCAHLGKLGKPATNNTQNPEKLTFILFPNLLKISSWLRGSANFSAPNLKFWNSTLTWWCLRPPGSKEPWGFLNVFSEMCKLTFRDVSSVGLSSPICKMNKMPTPHERSGSLIIIWNSLHLSRSKAMQDLIKSKLWVSISGLPYP